MPRPQKTEEQIAREQADRERADAVPMTARCAEPGCEDWVYVGTTGECRVVSAEHRASRHPGLVDRRAKAREKSERRRKALEEQKKQAQRKTLLTTPARPGRPQVSREDAILALKAVAAEKGRTPTSTEWLVEKRRPGLPTLNRIFGTWRGAVSAASLEPARRRREAA